MDGQGDGFVGVVLDGVKQGGIDPGQLGQHLRIDLVALAFILVNGSKFASIGDDDLTVGLCQESADPRTVSANLQRDERFGIVCRELEQVLAGNREGKFLENNSLLVSHTDGVFSVPEVDADYEL